MPGGAHQRQHRHIIVGRRSTHEVLGCLQDREAQVAGASARRALSCRDRPLQSEFLSIAFRNRGTSQCWGSEGNGPFRRRNRDRQTPDGDSIPRAIRNDDAKAEGREIISRSHRHSRPTSSA